MLAVTFIVSCVSACGFYAYVFVHLDRERKRLNAHKKRLPEHLYEMEPEADRSAAGGHEKTESTQGLATSPKAGARDSVRRETLIQLSVAVGGLAALFAGIELFNSLVTWLHWN